MLMNPAGEREEKVDHPTQKPVALYTRPIENHLEAGECFYEPFGGSGSAIAAAETTGRRCFAIELDPKYVDVIVARWERLSGQSRTEDVVKRSSSARPTAATSRRTSRSRGRPCGPPAGDAPSRRTSLPGPARRRRPGRTRARHRRAAAGSRGGRGLVVGPVSEGMREEIATARRRHPGPLRRDGGAPRAGVRRWLRGSSWAWEDRAALPRRARGSRLPLCPGR